MGIFLKNFKKTFEKFRGLLRKISRIISKNLKNFGTFWAQTIGKFSNTTEEVWKTIFKNSDKFGEDIRENFGKIKKKNEETVRIQQRSF